MNKKNLSKVLEEFIGKKKEDLSLEEQKIATHLQDLKQIEEREGRLQRVVDAVVGAEESTPQMTTSNTTGTTVTATIIPEKTAPKMKLGAKKSSSLVERDVVKGILLERESAKLPEGVLCRVQYPICNVGELNANKRVYEMDVWEKVLSDEQLQKKMSDRNLFGHAEHPTEVQSNLEKVSHVITKTWVDENKNIVYQEMDVLDTPYGRIVDTLLRADCKVGVSTRAEGELQEAEDEQKGKHYRVVADSYRYVTTDFTADPSTFGALPVKVERQCLDILKRGLEEKKIDDEFASLMLENFKTQEAHVLLESVKKKDPVMNFMEVRESIAACSSVEDIDKLKVYVQSNENYYTDAERKVIDEKFEWKMKKFLAEQQKIEEASKTKREVAKKFLKAGKAISGGFGFWRHAAIEDNDNSLEMVAAWIDALKEKGYSDVDIVLYGDWRDGRHIADQIEPETKYSAFKKIVADQSADKKTVEADNKANYDESAVAEVKNALGLEELKVDESYDDYEKLNDMIMNAADEKQLRAAIGRLESAYKREKLTKDQFVKLNLKIDDKIPGLKSKKKETVKESFDSMVKFFEENADKLAKEQLAHLESLLTEGRQKPQPKAVPLKENKALVAANSKILTDLEIKEAIARAERDTALELVVKANEERDAAVLSVVKESVSGSLVDELEARITTLNLKLDEMSANYKTAESVLENLTAEREVLKQQINDLNENHNRAISEIADLHDSEIKEIKEAKAKEVQTLKESHAADLKKKEEEFRKKELKKYFESKLESSRLSLPTNALAILEQARSEKEIDDLLNEFRDVMREGALHSSALKEVKVSETRAAGPADKVAQTVGVIMEGMFGGKK